MVDDCLFCKIVADEIPAEIVHEDESVLAFPDIAPKAPTHLLLIPKKHFATVAELGGDPAASAGLLAGLAAVVGKLGLESYRTVFNTGAAAGQSVFHVHAHVLAGRPLTWPPG
jgi:histidine triad (HIT) family protein